MTRFLLSMGATCAVLAVVGCDALTGANERPKGTRQVQLTLPQELTRSLGTQVTGVQLAGVVINKDQYTLFTSPPVDPADQDLLIAYLPKDQSPVIVVQTLGSGKNSPGRLVARVRFANGFGGTTSRIPRGSADVSMGTPQHQGQAGQPASSFLDLEEIRNPLLVIDSDSDGIFDFSDDDDDADSVLDDADDDADGDGINDLDQSFSALKDQDINGIPDIFE